MFIATQSFEPWRLSSGIKHWYWGIDFDRQSQCFPNQNGISSRPWLSLDPAWASPCVGSLWRSPASCWGWPAPHGTRCTSILEGRGGTAWSRGCSRLQWPRWTSPTCRGSPCPMAKIGFLDLKPRFWAQKKESLLNSNHVLATTGKSCSKKKVAFSQINISLLRNFGWFFGLKPIFGQKTLFGRTDRVCCPSGSFFDVPDGSTKFRWKRSKIKGTYTSKVTQAPNGPKQGWALKNDP